MVAACRLLLRVAPLALLLYLFVPVAQAFEPAPNYNPIGTYGFGLVSLPIGIAIAPNGDTYVSVSGTKRIEKFSKHSTHLLGWGGAGSGDGQFTDPYGLAIDQATGDVYVVDDAANRVQKFTANGTYVLQFGSAGSGPGQFDSPKALAIDASGNVYVVDSSNHRVQKFTSGGVYLSQFGSQGNGDGQFYFPNGIAIDAAGDLYIADGFNYRVQKFNSAGAFLRKWGSQGTGNGQFGFVFAIAVDGGGNVYVDDVNNNRIQRFTSTGVFIAKWGSSGADMGQLQTPYSLAVAPNGDVHVNDTYNSRVQVFRCRFSQGHESILSWGTNGTTNGQFLEPRGIAVAPNGFVYVADKALDRIQKFTGFGAWAAAWGSTGDADGEFNGPVGVATDNAGNVYVTEEGNSRVQKFDGNGNFITRWGGLGTAPGQFTGIWDIAIDANNNVYVADLNRVQKFTSSGSWVTEFYPPFPTGLGVDGEGMLYVTCGSNHTVRKYGPDGSHLRTWGSFGTNPGQFNAPRDVVADTAGYIYVCDNNDRIQQFTALGGYLSEWGQTGNGTRDISVPSMMSCDPHGNVYVTEFGNTRVHKFASPPELLEIADVLGDNGNSVKVTFTRTSAEAPSSGGNPTEYKILLTNHNAQPFPTLTVLATIPVDGVTTSAIVNIPANATHQYTGLFEFGVRTNMPVPGAFPLLENNYGFAVDNLAPDTPDPFTAEYISSTNSTALSWGASDPPDFSVYRLYRGNTAEFALSPGNLILESPDRGYTDPDQIGQYYQLVSADTSGNVSPPAHVGPDETVDTPPPAVAVHFRLDEVRPNPTRANELYVHFVLPDAQPARIDLIDVAGRGVWSREVQQAGPHALRVDADLSSGIYFLRLTRADDALVRRVAILN